MSEMKTTVVIDGRDLLSPLMQNILANSSRMRMELTRSTGMDTGMAGLLTGKGVSTSVADGIRRVATELTGVFSAYQALSTAKGFLEKGVEFNAMWEQSRLGIGSIITAVDTLTDAQGKTLTGMEKYSAAQALAEQSMKRIQVSALETTATTEEMVKAFQVLIGPTAAVGGNLEQTADLAYSIVQAMGALNIPMRELSSESRALLEGSIQQTQDRLAVSLGITNDMVRSWKAQGTLIQEILKRLEPFKLAGKDVADTWGGLTSNLKDAVSFLSGQTGRGIFTGAKQGFREIMAEIIDTRDLTAGKDIGNITDAVTRLNNAIGGGVVSATRSFIEVLHELNDPEVLGAAESRLRNIVSAAGDIASLLGTAASGMGIVFGSVLDGWNSMPEIIRDAGLIMAILGGPYGRGAFALIGAATTAFNQLNDAASARRAVSDGTANNAQLLRAKEADLAALESASGEADLSAPIARLKAEIAALKQARADLRAQDRTELVNAQRATTMTGNLGSGVTVSASPRDAAGATDAQKRKITEAMQAITKELAQMTDTGTEGEGRIAALTKKYEDFAETLGKGAPKVKEFAAVIDYASAHNGYTPQQVSQFERGVQKEISALEDKAAAMRAATRDDGTIDQQRYGMLTATAAAEREYRDDLLRGIDETVAAKKRDLAVSDAAAQKRQQDLAAYNAFYQELAGLYANDETLQRRIMEKRIQAFRENNISELDIARWKSRQELNIATDAYSGMKRGMISFYEESTNAAKQWERVTSEGFSSLTDVITDWSMGAQEDINDVGKSLARLAIQTGVQQSITGPLAGIFSGWTDSLRGLLTFNARGGAYASDSLAEYSGQVVSKPTMFMFARGGAPNIGVAGEGSSKEVILPIAPDSQGRYGVRGEISQAAPVTNVYVESPPGYQGSVQQQANGSGGTDIRVSLRRMTNDDLAAGQFDRAMSARYGVYPRTSGR